MRRLFKSLARRCSRPWRFSLAAALIVVTAFCVGLGIYVNRPQPMVAGTMDLYRASHLVPFANDVQFNTAGMDQAKDGMAEFLVSDGHMANVLADARVKSLSWVKETNPSVEELRRRLRVYRNGDRLSLLMRGAPPNDMEAIVNVTLQMARTQPSPLELWRRIRLNEQALRIADEKRQQELQRLREVQQQLDTEIEAIQQNMHECHSMLIERQRSPQHIEEFPVNQESAALEGHIRMLQWAADGIDSQLSMIRREVHLVTIAPDFVPWKPSLLFDPFGDPCTPAGLVTSEEVDRLGDDVTPLPQ